MLRACTLWNPWAWAVISAGKDVENRPRSLGYVGDIAIHVSLNWEDLRVQSDLQRVAAVMKACGHASANVVRDNPFTMYAMLHRQRGMIIGIAHFAHWYPLPVDCAPAAWESGPWCCRLEDPRPLKEPIRVRGYQGVWTLPEDVEQRVREQLEVANGRA